MSQGEIFVINVDDTDPSYKLSYDVNIKEFYTRDSFPQEIWNFKVLKRKEFF